MTTNAERAASLRQIADWMEAHPEIEVGINEIGCGSLNSKEEAKALLLALKPCKKTYSNELFIISRKFGAIDLRFTFWRNQVCTRRVVGVTTVEAKFMPAVTIPARTIEQVEWDCAPLLAGTDPAEAGLEEDSAAEAP